RNTSSTGEASASASKLAPDSVRIESSARVTSSEESIVEPSPSSLSNEAKVYSIIASLPVNYSGYTQMEPLRIEQFFLGFLAPASYLVASDGIAAVIDPQRDVDLYIEFAKQNNLKIEHIIETHLHADFVSGHHELAERTGARIYLGEDAHATFPHTPIHDGDTLQFGNARFNFLHTPGHTSESVCAVLTDVASPSQPRAIFTGDTLFVGDVGRPDLSADHTPQQLAGLLYHSLHDKLLKLPDE